MNYFLGHVVSRDGIKADPKKVHAISNLPQPTNKTKLQKFFRMPNYLGKFIPNLSIESANLRKLPEKDNEYVFDFPQIEALNKLKQLVANTQTLKYFDKNLPIKVTWDASKLGLGAMLEHLHGTVWYHTAFASRSLTAAEQSYSQVEKKTLSIVFSCEKFREYVYGLRFVVENDHKPLISISQRALSKSEPRTQRFLLRLQCYNFQLNYVPGNQLFFADILSRLPLLNSTSEIKSNKMNYYFHSVIKSCQISEDHLQQIITETQEDDILQLIVLQIQNGWTDPDTTKVKPYFTVKDSLTLYKELILKDLGVVVPLTLRSEILIILHQEHIGIERPKLRAQNTVYWPGISKDITELISNCETCISFWNAQPIEPLLKYEIPDQPWVKIGADLFSFDNKDYVIVVDYTSKFFEISRLPNTEASTIINHTKAIFSHYGIPREIVSDTGPQFTSYEYKKIFSRVGF